MRSGQLAAAVGVNLQTLRYYERRGLLPEPTRTLGGHRAYPPEAVTRLRLIKSAQRLGFTLTEIADLLGPRRNWSTSSGLHTHAAGKLAEVEARIDELTGIAETLRAALTVGCDDLAECATTPDCPLSL
ncbi:MerR family mercuric resistance operon transcriptional regulator [Kribbella sp. VKM Ac-2527]|uniref:MerR family mercuric resistance operon transcriptional regulator n=1 Tax=Kribbella caucasensis TaxID=2512215 RepID=A0A4R6J6A8_9ACTN|nr:MerR family transcriptional regulator [Kribbella sp. VKM Ac-2527]TDO30597.1 MerR family mercuric resistance operon transcriptional regulator [Kribbella sp. VKM Ac-2527]